MAKPRVVKLASPGQATLIYMSEEKADEYEKLLLNFDAGKEAAGGAQLDGVALSLIQNPVTKAYELVTIRFSPLTREAKLDSIKEVATHKNRAVEAFKIALIRNKLV